MAPNDTHGLYKNGKVLADHSLQGFWVVLNRCEKLG
jgi:hypothetical protein